MFFCLGYLLLPNKGSTVSNRRTLENSLKFQIIFCAIYKKKKSPIALFFSTLTVPWGFLYALESFFPFYTPLSLLILFFAKPPGRLGGDCLSILFTPLPAGKPFPLDRATVFSLVFSSHLQPQKPSSFPQRWHHPRQLPHWPATPDPWSKEAELPELHSRSCHHKEPFLLRF